MVWEGGKSGSCYDIDVGKLSSKLFLWEFRREDVEVKDVVN